MSAPLTLQSLPLFPLQAVLFPGGVLPLRVFEVRYLDMIGRCHRAGAPFGVILLTQGSEVRQPTGVEAFAQVGTLAEIGELVAPQDGLMLVRAVAMQRFRIKASNRLRHGLWVADIEKLSPDATVALPEDLKKIAQALEKLIASIEKKSNASERTLPSGPGQFNDCGWVANRWCELLPLPLPLKQQLMELENPLLRLELVSEVLTRTGIVE